MQAEKLLHCAGDPGLHILREEPLESLRQFMVFNDLFHEVAIKDPPFRRGAFLELLGNHAGDGQRPRPGFAGNSEGGLLGKRMKVRFSFPHKCGLGIEISPAKLK